MKRHLPTSLPIAFCLLSFLTVSEVGGIEVVGHRLEVEAEEALSVAGIPPGSLAPFAPSIATLPASSAFAREELEARLAADRSGGGPVRAGIERGRPAVEVAFDRHSTGTSVGRLDWSPGGAVWTGRIVVEDAWALRVRLDRVELPAGAQVWAWSPTGGHDGGPLTLGPYVDRHPNAAAALWLPATPGPAVTIEVHVPYPALVAGALRITGPVPRYPVRPCSRPGRPATSLSSNSTAFPRGRSTFLDGRPSVRNPARSSTP